MKRSAWIAAVFVLALSNMPAWATGQKVVIKGSNTFGEYLGPQLIAAFQKSSSGIDVALESKGSGSGFAALLAGECDIATSSRLASEDELRLARSRGIVMNVYTIGYYGVAVIVNAANPVQRLSDVDILRLFTGGVTNWAQIGGANVPVYLCIRDPISGTYLGFQELAMNRLPYAKSAKLYKSYEEIAAAVQADPGAIGYVGMDLLKSWGVRGVAVNGVLLSPLSVEEGRYPYARALRLYTNRRQESAAAMKFIGYALSRRGQMLLESSGFVKRAERRLWAPTEPW